MATESATGQQLDPRPIVRVLGFVAATPPERVAGGWDTLLWRFTTEDGQEHALRIYHLPRSQELARRERIALDACARAGLPAPRVEVVGEIEGQPAMVLSWCRGTTLLSAIERRPWAVWRLSRLFGRTQARVHAIAPPPELAAGAPDDWTMRVAGRYPELAAEVLALAPSNVSLVHLDFHPLNVIVDGSQVSGIIDWAGAAAGDPRADLARTAVTMLTAPLPPGPLRPLLGMARRLALRAWRSGYEELAGPMPDYRPFTAWAAATLLLEIELVVDRPEVWGTQQDLERLRAMIENREPVARE